MNDTLLHALAIPRCLRGFADDAPETQAYDVALRGGAVASIVPVAAAPLGTLISAPVDAHVHLDKNYSVQEVGAAQGNLFAAIERTAAHRARWTAEDLHRRMELGVQDAWHHGTRAIRTHLDWVEPEAPVSLPVFEALREQWRGRIALQFVSLTPLDLFADAAAGAAIARQVAQASGVLGAFVYRNAGLQQKLERVFALAVEHGLALDFHVDEGLDVEARGLPVIAELTLRHGLQGRVVCGHACSLSVQPEEEARATLALCAEAGLHLVALPTTNLYLQGAWDATPLQRGITRIKEAAEHGLRASLATDNVADAFYPYGSYDLVDTFGLGVQVAHLAPAQEWLDSITVRPAAALSLPWDGRLRAGCPAELVVLAARSEYELLSPAGRRRTVHRASDSP